MIYLLSRKQDVNCDEVVLVEGPEGSPSTRSRPRTPTASPTPSCCAPLAGCRQLHTVVAGQQEWRLVSHQAVNLAPHLGIVDPRLSSIEKKFDPEPDISCTAVSTMNPPVPESGVLAWRCGSCGTTVLVETPRLGPVVSSASHRSRTQWGRFCLICFRQDQVAQLPYRLFTVQQDGRTRVRRCGMKGTRQHARRFVCNNLLPSTRFCLIGIG